MKRQGFLYALFTLKAIILSSSLIAAESNLVAAPSTSLPELHVLVDTSGSMKKTDPENLRAKAINMFIFLMKQKAIMQIHTFATTPQLLIATKPVNQAFQKEYLAQKKLITANGAWTDIDKAINQANQGWGLGKKNIILLTDGTVDLGNQFRTQQSKNKLTLSTLNALQQKGVRVFTVGFSKAADKTLLDNLAAKTNGLSQVVAQAKDLDNVLYSMFTAIVPVNGTPIDTNKDSSRTIQIDKSINELTLIFKKTEDIANLFLTSPKGLKKRVVDLSEKDSSTLNYIFVRVEKPIAGNWLLTGPKQEIERAIILTDINLASNFTSGSYFQGETVPLIVYYTQQGNTLTTPIIIDNTQVKAILESSAQHLEYNVPYIDKGIFNRTLNIDYPVDFYRLTVRAQNQFLSREVQFVVDVTESPIKTSINNSIYTLSLARADLIKENTVTVDLTIDNASLTLEGIKTNEGWRIDLSPLCSNPSTIGNAWVIFKGKTVSDRAVELKLKIPTDICPAENQLKSEVSTVNWVSPSLIPKLDMQVFKVEKKSSIYLTVLLYSVIVLLLVVNGFIIGALYLYKKYGKKIILIKKQFQSENNHE